MSCHGDAKGPGNVCFGSVCVFYIFDGMKKYNDVTGYNFRLFFGRISDLLFSDPVLIHHTDLVSCLTDTIHTN